mmetsp:Transcript_27191/g.38259  ORF Transcript_27191/g.38259 Transcript_27191/m.38259 type:complete len:98 (+) Transcript_27191:1033-1326(+)
MDTQKKKTRHTKEDDREDCTQNHTHRKREKGIFIQKHTREKNKEVKQVQTEEIFQHDNKRIREHEKTTFQRQKEKTNIKNKTKTIYKKECAHHVPRK